MSMKCLHTQDPVSRSLERKQTLNQRIETRCQDDFPGTTSAGSVFSSTVEQDTELQSLLAGALITGNLNSRIAK
jgi:hypothetical protein